MSDRMQAKADIYHSGTERLRSSSLQISQKDADFEIQIGVICGSLLPFLVSLCLGGKYLTSPPVDCEVTADVMPRAVNELRNEMSTITRSRPVCLRLLVLAACLLFLS